MSLEGKTQQLVVEMVMEKKRKLSAVNRSSWLYSAIGMVGGLVTGVTALGLVVNHDHRFSSGAVFSTMLATGVFAFSVTAFLLNYAEKDTLQRDIGRLESTPEYQAWRRLEEGRARPQNYT